MHPNGVPHLYIYHQNQCDPDKCTGLKVARFGYAVIRHKFSGIPKRALILTPEGEKTLSADDREVITRFGLGAVDCSWATPEFLGRIDAARARSLPWLVAGNPINFGLAWRLSTLEAFAAALWIIGFRQYAQRLLSLYKWGGTFLTLNLESLERYANASADGMQEVQDSVMRDRLLG